MAQHMGPGEEFNVSNFGMECSNFISMYTTFLLVFNHPEVFENHTKDSLFEFIKLLVNFEGKIILGNGVSKYFFECFTIDVDEDDKEFINVFVDEPLILRMFNRVESMRHHPWTIFRNNEVNPNTDIFTDEDEYADEFAPCAPRKL